jgi:hypothetical protein
MGYKPLAFNYSKYASRSSKSVLTNPYVSLQSIVYGDLNCAQHLAS